MIEYPSKNWEETDVEVAITHCGCVLDVDNCSDINLTYVSCSVCGSDVHTITAGWGEVEMPLVVG